MPIGMILNTEQLDTIEFEVTEIENHLHNSEKWFGLAAVPDAELHRADRMAGGINPFILIAGNDVFGDWIQVIGSEDTPIQAGKTKLDFHRILITDTNSVNPFVIQIISGESAGFAAKLLAEDFDEIPYISGTNNNDSGISEIIDKRHDTGEKVWMRIACIGSDGSTMDLYIGIHEYDL